MSNLLIYQSSAGSGKTYKLAKEYLKLAFKYPGAFKNILSITFTNKATEEMKSRVLNFLIELSNGKDDKLKKQLIEEGVKGEIDELAKITLNSILHNYSDFSISTIDSFFNRVLRSFAKELKLQVGYKIELDQKEVLKEITKLLLKDLNKDEELRKYLEDFILMKITEDRGWDIEKDIIKLGGEIFKERYWEKKFNASESSEEKEISDSRKKIKTLMNDIMYIIKNFEEYLINIGDEAEKVIKQNGLSAGDFANKESGVMGFLLNKIRYKKEYDLEKSKRAVKVYTDNDGWYSKESKKKESISKAVNDGLYGLLKDAIEFIQNESAKYYSAKELKNTIYTLGVFEDLISKLNDYRKTNRQLLQSDVNIILQGLISTENSPFIYEKIGSNYKNLLIDEFQDTSTFQWKNLLPLIINVLSEKNNALVVGDVKQSIYRWRSGNMKLLLSQIYKDLEGFKELIKTEFLKMNRRSRKEIIEFNNRFFQKAIEEVTKDIEDEDYKKLMLKAYSDEGLLQDNEKQGGYVNITFFDYDMDDISTQEKAEQKVLETVKEILENGYLLSDILILVRKNEEVRRISSILSKSGYDIVSTESLLVNNSPKVRLIADLVKYILDNKNTLVKTDVLYNYLEFVLEENVEYSDIFEGAGKGFIENLPKEFFKENEIPKIKSILNDLNIYEVCENLIHIFGFDKYPDSYLLKFQDIILEYSMENNPDLQSFTEWWEEKKNEFSIDNPSNINAVNIMTIHKAKGLQGKNVIVPYANWKINIDGTKDLIWVSADEEPFSKSAAYPVKATNNLKNTFFFKDYNYEFAQTRFDNLNLLYVAFTRAKDRVYIFVPGKKTKDNVGNLLKKIISNYTSFNNNVYETGNKDKAPEREDESEIRTEKLKNFISTEWYKKTIIKPKHKKIREFKDKDYTSKMNRGVILHEVLSHIKTKNDIDAAINKVLIEGVITGEEKEKIKQSIKVLLDNKIIQNWFSDEWEVKSETDILINGGNVIRPDRVIMKGKDAIIIDYKTGIEKEENKKQISQYAETLNKMGFTGVKKYLLYINEEAEDNVKIVEVTE